MEMAEAGKAIQKSYNDIQGICSDMMKSLEKDHVYLNSIKRDIEVQQVRFKITNDDLSTAVQNVPLDGEHNNFMLYMSLTCQLKTILGLVRDIPSHLRRILNKFSEPVSRRLPHPFIAILKCLLDEKKIGS
ncbi:hypothetical protein SAMD00023353_0100520 [Rosellinia necatrix]|uniref:t-SNARE coiled-coil homology domain-containing protein n=1 Tax=Rosellinia necatrix TaxID=77044 RepID=A0A1S7UHA7_ROSNE|nr:hypothetical protein SAMD00023353_0100520 [Rosellinia necatrix]